MTENEKLAEAFGVGLKSNPPIKVSQEEFDALQAMIDIRPRPSPALILAMEKVRSGASLSTMEALRLVSRNPGEAR